MWKTFRGFLHVALWGNDVIKVGEKIDMPPVDLQKTNDAEDDERYRQARSRALVVDAQLAILRRELGIYKGDFNRDYGERQSS